MYRIRDRHSEHLVLRCEPAFAEPLRLRFERLDAKETRRLDALDLKFRHGYLAELTEAERGRIIVEVTAGGAEAESTFLASSATARAITRCRPPGTATGFARSFWRGWGGHCIASGRRTGGPTPSVKCRSSRLP
ncbi:MAG: hypothetical protein WD929_03140 [Steroidobacteraceae bacterium]